jgi:hypothetical protein
MLQFTTIEGEVGNFLKGWGEAVKNNFLPPILPFFLLARP